MSSTKELEKYPSFTIGSDPERRRPDYDSEFAGASVEEDRSQAEENQDHTSTGTAGRRSRLKVTRRHPEALEDLADQFGMSKAGVYNFALSRLAQQEGLL